MPQLREAPSELLRLPLDTIQNEQIHVYKYLSDDFLRLAEKGVRWQVRREILKSTLQAIAKLHEHDVVHLGKYVITLLGTLI